MNADDFKVINDIEKLKETLLSFSEKEKYYQSEIKILKEQIKILRDKIYGRKTEKILKVDRQLPLFDISEAETSLLEESEEITVDSHSRKKRGRKSLPENLPRVDVLHDLSDEEKKCQCGHTKSRIGQEESEQLDYIPAKVQVIRNIRYKYACKKCEGVEDDGPTVSIARMPDQIIPKSIATPGLLAHIFTAKFADAIPFYRQEKQFARIRLNLPRSSMCNWAIKTADACEIIINMMQDDVLESPLINIDETSLKVLKEPGRLQSYMWVFKGTARGRPVILYQYHPTKSADVAVNFLKNYKGIVQTDGNQAYNFLDNKKDIIHVGCWVHARRNETSEIMESSLVSSFK